jgi:hypothetical protein
MASHYYHPLTGELIDGDLRAARKVGGLPSPTTVLQMLSSPGLKFYFRRQIYEAAITTPRAVGMSDEEHWEACQKRADEHGQKARDRGGDFHNMVQKFHMAMIEGRPWNPFECEQGQAMDAYVDWYAKRIHRSVMVEQVVRGQGYGGRVDHVAELIEPMLSMPRTACMDVKTQDITKKGRFTYYPEWGIQLGAYAGAIHPMPDVLVSVVVSAKLPVVIEAYTWPQPPAYYHKLFLGLLEVWKFQMNYDPPL